MIIENNENLGEKFIGNDIKFKIRKEIINKKYNKCYECKQCFDINVSLKKYKSHCLECGIKNYNNKIETANLKNITILITGIRVKIGYHTALRILRNGGNVIGTTRYPNLALNNYANEKDYEDWKERLKIIKCNFLNIDEVYGFLDIINNYKINGFINMAFRTIKPTEYYNNKVDELETDLSSKILLKNSDENETRLIIKNKINNNYLDLNKMDVTCIQNNDIKLNIFKNITDEDQIIENTAWNKKMSEIGRDEIVECMALNQLVPTLIIKELKDKLIGPKFIIHVTSLEGQFNTSKTDKHFHTNMCKASMNMLIKTLGEDDDKDLSVHAICPGFVSGITTTNKEYTVSQEDAAAKITFPIFECLNGKKLDKRFIKMRNYEPCEW